eukprot:CAMPEP_0185571688 /NCGR_PEP_ID=MMETSP0434-20130131/3701_1 /TAXON_ID=626734 ORGANISM="Favella taraikaensis, Strain Fe Narragansett Bay" /NCGR_SAMPLE_ID=MMETSP0434 /ASSEMBLY_ACC=CAM_ASM_000379 /LENGTH=46 /DNA_ID= /DNA_START= /DNA_END= /DNA_ORIENTATION=
MSPSTSLTPLLRAPTDTDTPLLQRVAQLHNVAVDVRSWLLSSTMPP